MLWAMTRSAQHDPTPLYAALTLVALLAPQAACESEDSYAAQPRGLQTAPSGNVPPPAAPEATPPPRLGRPVRDAPEYPSFEPRAAARAAEDGGTAAPGRDLSAELGSALGMPTQCLAGAPSAPLITVNVTASVTEDGRVLRASASGPLTPAGLECMRARAMAVRLRSPVPRAPLTVVAAVRFRQTAAGTAATRTPVPPPPPRVPTGAQAIQGPSGTPARPRQGVAIQPRQGVAIEANPGMRAVPNEGVAIMGPSGTPIGQ